MGQVLTRLQVLIGNATLVSTHEYLQVPPSTPYFLCKRMKQIPEKLIGINLNHFRCTSKRFLSLRVLGFVSKGHLDLIPWDGIWELTP